MKFFNIFTSLVAAATTMIATLTALPVDISEWINVDSDRSVIFDGLRSVREKQIVLWERKINQQLAEQYKLYWDNYQWEEETDQVAETEDSSFQNQEILQVEKKINQLIADITSDRNMIYQELFAANRLLLKKGNWQKLWFFEDKIIFKLSNLIQNEIMSEFDSSLLYRKKPFDDIYFETWGGTSFPDNGNEYQMPMHINFVKNYRIIKEWPQLLVWKPKLHYTQSLPNKPLNLVAKAGSFSLTLDKKMFSDWPSFTTGWDLFYYLKGGLEEIAIDFSIAPIVKENMDLPLKTTNFLVNVSFKDHKVFNATLTENHAEVDFYPGKNTRKNTISLHNINRKQNVIFSKSELEGSIATLFKEMKFKFKNCWSVSDRIGVVTKTAKTLLYDIFDSYAQDVSVTSNFAASTLLKDIMNENGALNFTWIIATPNHIIKYENLATNTIIIEDKRQNFKYWINTNSYSYSPFLRYHKDLVKFITAKAKTFDDSLIIFYDQNDETNFNSRLRNANFDLSVYEHIFDSHGKYIEGEFVGSIKYRYQNLHRKLTFELKADIIRAMQQAQNVTKIIK